MKEEYGIHKPFAENQALTAPGEHFPMPIVLLGAVIYFGSLKNVKVPLELQPAFSYNLYQEIIKEAFPRVTNGDTCSGRVEVALEDGQVVFEICLTFHKNDHDDYYEINSILPV